ncbi:MAG: hypothetical protein Q9170_004397 [Blastenia crenularia]
MGAGQAFGFCVGLVLGGIFVDTIGWRVGYYMCAATSFVFAPVSYWSVPKDKQSSHNVLQRLRTELDWIGAVLLSTSLGLLSYVLALFFQEIQHLSSLQTALRFLPEVATGAVLNILTGFYAHKFHAGVIVSVSTLLSALAPLLMAITNPEWSYWYSAFWAMLILPVSADGEELRLNNATVLFTVAALVVTSAFPDKTQALGGAVFQTLAQFGNSLGLAIMASVSSAVTANSGYPVKTSPAALLEGYRVTFWVNLGWVLLAVVVGSFGMRKAGRIGLKRE